MTRSLAVRVQKLGANGRGIFWMVLSGLGFSAMAALVKLAAQAGFNGFEIAFFRAAFGFLALMPFIAKAGIGALATRHPRAHLLRAALGIGAMICAYFGIGLMPLADYTALSFAKPLFAIILAVFVLGETVRWRRWAATLLGFVGVLIMMRPGAEAVNWGAFLALGDAFAIAILIVIVKRLPTSETPLVMLFYFGLPASLFALLPALFFWRWPTGMDWAILAGIGGLGALSQYWWILAFKSGAASIVAPFDYLRLVFAGAIGFWIFAERPDLWTFSGAAIILVSVAYIAAREARLRRQERRLSGVTSS